MQSLLARVSPRAERIGLWVLLVAGIMVIPLTLIDSRPWSARDYIRVVCIGGLALTAAYRLFLRKRPDA